MKINLKEYTPKQEEISIPEWTDEPLFVRELIGRQLEVLQKYTSLDKGKSVTKHQNALLILSSLVDKDGDYLFTEDDIDFIETQPVSIIAKIIGAVTRVSDLTL